MTARLSAGAGGQWSGNVATRELSGDVVWRPEGRGRGQARLKQFSIPEDRPPPPGDPSAPVGLRPHFRMHMALTVRRQFAVVPVAYALAAQPLKNSWRPSALSAT